MGSDAITLNFLKKLDSTDCCMWPLERLDFESDLILKFLVFDFIKRILRFAFIQAKNISFLKLNRILTKIDISCVKS